MGECCDQSSAFIFGGIFFILISNKDNYKSLNELKFVKIPPLATELAGFERFKKIMNSLVTTLAPLFLYWIFLILSDKKDNHKLWDGSKFCKIRQPAAELAALERQEKSP